MLREYTDGATAIARGALKAGCNFFAAYPITPQTPLLLHRVNALPKVGGIGIQAEDEIAAISLWIGAAMTGARAMTATSGSGICLFSENIGLAIMGEVPLVIVDVQRMGPATGGATTVAQGDVQFVRWGTSGGYPIIALAPSSIPECYTRTQRAFHFAERFRCPVFLVTDKELNLTLATVDADQYVDLPVQGRTVAETNPQGARYKPYAFNQLDSIPAIAHIGDPNRVRFTGSTHDERGLLVKDPPQADRLNRHFAAKVEAKLDELELTRADLDPGAKTLVISYGITMSSVREAVQTARGRVAGHLRQIPSPVACFPRPGSGTMPPGRGSSSRKSYPSSRNMPRLQRNSPATGCARVMPSSAAGSIHGSPSKQVNRALAFCSSIKSTI